MSLLGGPIKLSGPYPDIVGQYEDGTWYWRNEAYEIEDPTRYATRDEAQKALDKYCDELYAGLIACNYSALEDDL